MKITDYPEATSLASDDSFVVDGPTNGTRHIPQENLPWGQGGSGSVPATDPVWVSHRNTYRGESLGSVYTEEQKEMVRNNTFDDIYVGDYWTIGGIDWLVADINYWWNVRGPNNPSFNNTPHLAIIPKTILYNTIFNDDISGAGAYLNSDIRKTGLTQANNLIRNCFGENCFYQHKDMLTNSVNNTLIASTVWVDSNESELPTFEMVHEPNHFITSSHDGINADASVLSIFRFNPSLAITGQDYFTRSYTNIYVIYLAADGLPHFINSSVSMGVRPVFGLIG